MKSLISKTKYNYKRIEEDGVGYKFLICLDGSEQSKKAFKSVKDLYDPKHDEVYGTCVSGGKYCDHICAKDAINEFNQFLIDNKMRGRYI